MRLEHLRAAAPPGRAQALLGALAATTAETLQRVMPGKAGDVSMATAGPAPRPGSPHDERGSGDAQTEGEVDEREPRDAQAKGDDEGDASDADEDTWPRPEITPIPGVESVDALFSATAAKKKVCILCVWSRCPIRPSAPQFLLIVRSTFFLSSP